MMQSVALTDSVQHDDDFVVVEAPLGSDDTTSYDDEASYDYCDDVFSIASIAQSFSVSSHALHSLQEDFFTYPHPDLFSKTGEEGLPADLQELRISSVEAAVGDDDTQKAASELSSAATYNIESSPEETSIHAKEIPEATADESAGEGEESSPCEDSASKNSGSEQESSDSSNEDRASSPSSGDESRSSGMLSSPFDEEKEDSGGSTDEDNAEAVANAMADALEKKSSRMSGKKRRKQLKLAKKAAAAAAAAAALGQMTMPVQTTTARGRKNRQTTPRSSGKKVANIAVSCATHAVAAYREELRLKKQIR